jgi:uncharacterized protein
MLYDQALMAIAFIETYQATGKEIYKDAAREIFTYVLRDLADPKGGFFAAEDADSEGMEGKYYLWQENEIRQALGPKESDLVFQVFGVRKEGNINDQVAGQIIGRNVLHITKPISDLAAEIGIGATELQEKLDRARIKLFAYRNTRVHPHKDDKILTDWNGLMIAALALGAQVFNEPAYTEAARKAANFIMGSLRDSNGRLMHRYRDGEAAMKANIDDYSFLIWGLLNLYETTYDIRYLRDAVELNGDSLEHYWDSEGGGFFFTADDCADLPIRQKEIYDGALPSGNSIAALNLLRLGRITGNIELENRAEAIHILVSGQVRTAPLAFTMLLSSFDFALGPSSEIVIVGRLNSDDTQLMLRALRQKYIPNKVVIVRPSKQDAPELVQFADFVRNQKSIHGKATAYICRNYSCDMPTTDISKMLELLDSKGPETPL